MNARMMKQAPLAAAVSVLFVLASQAQAQQVPNAGSILQQTQQPKPPSASPAGTGLTIEQSNGNAAPASAPFPVSEIQITGNTKFDTATLHALVADAEGKNLSLAQLEETANRITAYYHSHGYPLARAVIPAQTVKNGVIHLMVIEARYGKVNLDNHSRAGDGLLNDVLSPLQSGQAIEQGALDHTLLMLQDLNGVTVGATLKPGLDVGTSDLDIVTTTPQAVSGSLAADNFGNRYTGRARLGGSLNVFDPLHQGDLLSANVLTTGSDMNYGRLGYELFVNGAGTRVGASYSALHYTLGDTLSALDGHGTAQVGSLWAKQTFIRTPNLNLYGQLEYDHKQLKDDIDATDVQTDRHLDELTATLYGDWRDATGVNSWSTAVTQGRAEFDNATAQLADAATAKTQGSFTKWVGAFNRLQGLGQSDSLYVAVSAQWANTNLDASEKMVAGGVYTVRAYDMGAVSGDTGVLGNIEWRHELGQVAGGQTQGIVFFDSEHVTVNHSTWAPGSNSANLSGAGVGVNWYGPSNSAIKASVAAPVGATPELAGAKKSARGWLEVDLAF